jgi:photosystem II stability/assembly factor-like uncharacterized protein
MSHAFCTRLTCLAAAILPASFAIAQSWTELGPAPTNAFSGSTGRISAIACSRTAANTYYAGGADGGLWRSTDAGTTWTPLSNTVETSSVGAVTLDPVNESIIYVGTGEANFANHSRYGLGILKSTDAGATWTLMGSADLAGRCISRLIINPQNTQTIYAAVTHAGGFPTLAAAKGHPGATGPRGVFRSTDGGSTWTRLANLPNLCATDLAMDPTNPLILYAAIGYIFGDPANGIYKSTDGGDTWTKLTSGLPTGTVGRISLAIAPSNAQRLYSLFTNPCDADGNNGTVLGVRRTDNAGSTWTSLSSGLDQSTYGWYLSVVAVSPTAPDTCVLGGLSAVRTTNAGSAWSTISAPHPDHHAFVFDASGRLLVGCDGGLYVSSNLGSAWTAHNAGLGTVQFYAGLSTDPTNTNIILGGLQDNGSCRRNTGTLTWPQVNGGDGGWTQIDQANSQRMFVESQGTGAIVRSTNGGSSFSDVSSGLSGRSCFENPYLIDPQNSNHMLYGTERVFQSTNGGTSWTALSPDLTGGGADAAIRALAIAPSNSSYVYAATNDGRVQASTNGGSTFTLRLSNNPGWPRTTRELTVDTQNPQTVYLAGAAFGVPHVRRSMDAGATWQTLDGNLPDIPVNVIGIDPESPASVIFAGTDQGLYRSVNDGLSWRRYGPTSPAPGSLPTCVVVDILVDHPRSRVVIGTQGRGSWSAPLTFCYADLDDDGTPTVNDFLVFLQLFALNSPRANCDGSTTPPVLNVNDFTCFLQKFAQGCP